jgi:hypothetical protein
VAVSNLRDCESSTCTFSADAKASSSTVAPHSYRLKPRSGGYIFLRMRRCRLLSFVLAALVWAAPISPALAQSAQTQTVTDRHGRFAIDFPGDWEVTARESGMPAVIGVAPGISGDFRPSVNVVVEDLPRALSATTYAELNERTLGAVFRDFKVLQQGPYTIGGLEAYYRYFTWLPNSGRALYQVQIYLTVGVLGFVVTGTTVNDPEYIRRDMPTISQIIATFRPTASDPGILLMARAATFPTR